MLTVYGIPTCDTCKTALRWRAEHNTAHQWVDLREHPPAESVVRAGVGAVGSAALRNTSGGSYRALGDEKKGWTEEQWIAAFSQDPMLIKRPVITRTSSGAVVMVGFRGTSDALRAQLLSP